MKLTIEPTNEMFATADGTMIRAWKGVDQAGEDAIVLVAGVSLTKGTGATDLVAALTPIPPPDPAWSDALRASMGKLWLIAGRLSDREAATVLAFAAARAAYRDPTCPARQCDNCGQEYRGTAVFCSHACAMGAA